MELLDDLRAEQEALERIVEPLDDPAWSIDTPSSGWTIAHQVAHLTYFDRAAARSIADPDGFAAERDVLLQQAMQGVPLDELTIAELVDEPPSELLGDWVEGRALLDAAAAGLSEEDRVEWFGPSMSARSFLTARLMEVWAHGLDIIDALDDAGVAHAEREPTDRLRHIAHLGYVTRGWSYAVRGEDPPTSEVTVNLEAPSGTTWTWGPPEASETIEGNAWEFCAVVTQRRNVADTQLRVSGDDAAGWMQRAQAFAGGPTTRAPSS